MRVCSDGAGGGGGESFAATRVSGESRVVLLPGHELDVPGGFVAAPIVTDTPLPRCRAQPFIAVIALSPAIDPSTNSTITEPRGLLHLYRKMTCVEFRRASWPRGMRRLGPGRRGSGCGVDPPAAVRPPCSSFHVGSTPLSSSFPSCSSEHAMHHMCTQLSLTGQPSNGTRVLCESVRRPPPDRRRPPPSETEIRHAHAGSISMRGS